MNLVMPGVFAEMWGERGQTILAANEAAAEATAAVLEAMNADLSGVWESRWWEA